MFWFKKKKKEVISKHHCFWGKSLGKYYKLYRTEYRNCFDSVKVYERKQCECGRYTDICISSNEFVPSLFQNDFTEKEFIKELRSKGIKEEYEINLETNMTSNREDCFCC